jgi:hypothetical protein
MKTHRSDRNGIRMPEAEPVVPKQAGKPAQHDVPPLTAEDQIAIMEFNARQQVLPDLTVGCILKNHTGIHIHGPPGVTASMAVGSGE